MPSINDVIEYAELLRVCPIQIEESKCSAVRNRNSRCKKCKTACIADAITIKDNEISISSALCVDCGVCLAVCPNNALFSSDHSSQKILANAKSVSDSKTGCVVIACARAASKHIADPDKIVQVPCLGFIGEEVLLKLDAHGFDDIVLVDGDCNTCKYGKASPLIDVSVDTAGDLIAPTYAETVITRTSEFPSEVIGESKRNIRGEDRRGLLSQTGSYMKSVAGSVAQKAMDDALGSKKPKTLRERLGIGKSGQITPFEPTHNYEILDDMATLATRADSEDKLHSTDARIKSRHFGYLTIDAEKCSGCGLCVLLCPTEAMKYDEYDHPEDLTHRYIEFQAADCTQCHLCEDVCIRRCLKIFDRVAVSELFDFEPRLVEISKPPEKSGILSRGH